MVVSLYVEDVSEQHGVWYQSFVFLRPGICKGRRVMGWSGSVESDCYSQCMADICRGQRERDTFKDGSGGWCLMK